MSAICQLREGRMCGMKTPSAAATRRRILAGLAGGLRTTAAAGLLLALTPPATPRAAEPRRERDRDHDRAREALERGEALPLTDILARVRPALGGEVVGVSFKRDRDNGGRWIYEFKVIRPDGRLVEMDVDARTARVLKRETE
jgi:uncharacterized membrane protein YkoI